MLETLSPKSVEQRLLPVRNIDLYRPLVAGYEGRDQRRGGLKFRGDDGAHHEKVVLAHPQREGGDAKGRAAAEHGTTVGLSDLCFERVLPVCAVYFSVKLVNGTEVINREWGNIAPSMRTWSLVEDQPVDGFQLAKTELRIEPPGLWPCDQHCWSFGIRQVRQTVLHDRSGKTLPTEVFSDDHHTDRSQSAAVQEEGYARYDFALNGPMPEYYASFENPTPVFKRVLPADALR